MVGPRAVVKRLTKHVPDVSHPEEEAVVDHLYHTMSAEAFFGYLGWVRIPEKMKAEYYAAAIPFEEGLRMVEGVPEVLNMERLRLAPSDPGYLQRPVPRVYEEEGHLCVWVNTSFEDNNNIIGWFDHDYAEAASQREPGTVAEVLAQISNAPDWLPAVVAAAEQQQIQKITEGFVLFDHHYPAIAGPMPTIPGARFIGNFRFSRA